MKKVNIILATIVLSTTTAFAQDFVNIFSSTGYGFGMGGYYLGSSNTFFEDRETPLETNDHFLNLGQGLKFEIGAGYMLMPFLEGRVSFDLSLGVPSPTIESERTNEIFEDTTTDYRFSSWGLRAALAPHFEILELLDMYLGVGLALNFASASFERTIIETDEEPMIGEVKYNFSPSLGFMGFLGFEIPVMEYFLYFFSEIRFEQINHKLESTEVVSGEPFEHPITYTEDDVERNPPPNVPATNWGIRVGLKYWIF
ncbi:hypothetical protein QA601_04800 [Chitinispirillales bacterium ANBcel5]|uniref:hypothetical protein n=1 Tax=Cellulosispirillum alkaliphilum TaxID=3039283 RepID=UPI002A50372C|nr:hypothetical protein [Chitinispirillales bacterium ANBcel5]